MKTSNYVGITGGTVREAGASVWWDRGQGVSRAKLAETWEAAGLDPDLLPGNKSFDAALHDAVDDLRTRQHLVRQARGDVRGGWLIVLETTETGATSALDAWKGKPQAHAYLDNVKRLKIEFPDDTSPATRTDIEQRLRSAYTARRTTLDGGEVTGWVKSLLLKLRATLLREDGGVWFVPHDKLDEWHKMADAIHKATSTTLHEMATVFLGDQAHRTVGTILNAIQREAEEAITRTMGEIASAAERGKPLGADALRTREVRCRELAEKVSSYETLLGAALPDLTARIEQLQASCATAAMVAESERRQKQGRNTSLAGLV